MTGALYDANGNQLVTGANYDVENRLVAQSDSSGNDLSWGYAADNKRVWKKKGTGSTGYTEEVTFYGATGQRLGTYAIETGACD